MKTKGYVANLSRGTRVRLIGVEQHPKRGGECTIIEILPNPSQKSEHQWYDVRFDDASIGRFLEKHLVETSIIPLQEWGDFFADFSRRHESWLVEMETVDRETSEETASRALRLKSITLEDRMIIIVGEDEDDMISQLIRNPSRVLLIQGKGKREEGIEIDSDRHLVILRLREGVLPEAVGGAA